MKAKVAVLAGFIVGVMVAVLPAMGARNSSGTYSLPTGNPVVSGTTITSTWANTTLADLKTEMTNSLDRGGRGCMTAPTQITNGTVAAPSLTFCTDPDTGIYRVGANNPAMACGGVKCADWATTGASLPFGLTVANSQTNGNGVYATGNGTGAALEGHGSGVGNGVFGAGGATSGAGISGSGGGTGPGVTGTGGLTDGTGVSGTGGGTNGTGVTGTGQGSGFGVTGVGGSAGNGLYGLGGGNGSGVYGQGGATNGYGSFGQGGATNGGGAAGQGAGSGAGGSFTGGTTGKGVVATGQGGALGIEVASSATNIDVAKISGYINLSGATNPSSSTGFTNRQTPLNLVKSFGTVTTGASPAVVNGFNLTSVSCSASVVTVTLASAMTSASYTVIGTSNASFTLLSPISTTTFEARFYDAASALTNSCVSVWTLNFMALGAQ